MTPCLVAISQRVENDPATGERRDCLDQRWARLFARCGLAPLILPNHRDTVVDLLSRVAVAGFLLTGGNDIARVGGTVPERDEVEDLLLDRALASGTPLLGVCRGMQFIQDRFGIELQAVEGHVARVLEIQIEGQSRTVNSYHRFGARSTRDPLEAWGQARDGVVKAVRHRQLPLAGIMWHPEREFPFHSEDVAYMEQFFRP